jgi:hypothetical protein
MDNEDNEKGQFYAVLFHCKSLYLPPLARELGVL